MELESSKKLKVLEFYSGIGGMHYALQLAQVAAEVVEAFDINEVANDVYEHNFGHRPNQGNVQRLTVRQLDAYGADVWLMSPPCQPYTRQGLKKGSQDGRAKSFLALLDKLAAMARPPSRILVENVVGFEGSETREQLVAVLRAAAFSVRECILSPTQFGVPYSRPRYFCLAKAGPTAFPHPELEGCIWLRPFPPPGASMVSVSPSELDTWRTDPKAAHHIVESGDPGEAEFKEGSSAAIAPPGGTQECILLQAPECRFIGDFLEVQPSDAGHVAADGTFSPPIVAEGEGDEEEEESDEVARVSGCQLAGAAAGGLSCGRAGCSGCQLLSARSAAVELPGQPPQMSAGSSVRQGAADDEAPPGERWSPAGNAAAQAETHWSESRSRSRSSVCADEGGPNASCSEAEGSSRVSGARCGSADGAEPAHDSCAQSRQQRGGGSDQGLGGDAGPGGTVSKATGGLVSRLSEEEGSPRATGGPEVADVAPEHAAVHPNARWQLLNGGVRPAAAHEDDKWRAYMVPEEVLGRWGWATESTRCCCFTKSYVKFIKGTGSLLATQMLDRLRDSAYADANGRLPDGTVIFHSVPILELGLRYFTPREVANLHSLPDSFSFPPQICLTWEQFEH
eukprot:jgi/Mesen1/3390/ME000192S02555